MNNTDKLKRLVISCGGTGGHFYPGLSIARTFKQDGHTVMLFLCGKNSQAQAQIAAKYGINSLILPLAQKSMNPFRLMKFFKDLIKATFKARLTLSAFKPQALLAMGSFTSAPSAFAAISLGMPIFLHDGNARIGKANRFLSRWAKCLCLGFPAVNFQATLCPYILTGMPVRPELLGAKISKSEAIAEINKLYTASLSPNKPLILIFGGSQGAAVFNKTAPEALLMQTNKDFQVIHLTGSGKYEEVKNLYEKSEFDSLTLEKSDEMGLLYSAADAVLCRSGGSSVAELCIYGKFAILVPYPFAAEKHQDDNADFYAAGGAGIVISNNKCTVQELTITFKDWLERPDHYSERGKTALKLAKPDASEAIIKIINESL